MLGTRLAEAAAVIEKDDVPWTAVSKPLSESRLAVVTTAGVHHNEQVPFDMKDAGGDPTFRALDLSRPPSEFMITHDYYDHRDADKDINIVFPIQRLRELQQEGIIGEVARFHYGFMGHILGRHIQSLVTQSAPEVARRLKQDAVDAVFLTPG